MILSLEPVDIFLQIAKVYLLNKTKSWFGFGDLDSFLKVTGGFFLKYILNQWMDFI